MNIKYLILPTLLISLLTTAFTCKSPTESDGGNTEHKDDELVWDIDTLQALPNYDSVIPHDIWASSPTDVWIVGINPAWHGEILHYDGKKWNRFYPYDNIALKIGTFNMDFTCIWGFGKNDIYVGGYTFYFNGPSERGNDFENLILHYDGNTWSVVHDKSDGVINSIHGNNANDMWASGIDGTLIHKKNGQWQRVYDLDPNYDYQPIRALPNGDFYTSAAKSVVQVGDTATVYYYKYSNNKWSKIDSSRGVNNEGVISYHPKGFANNAYWLSPQGNLFGNGIYKLANDKWMRYTSTGGGFDLHGTSETNIYECGNRGRLSRYDGVQWYSTKWAGTYIDFRQVWVFEKEVFCAGYYQGKGYVVKGKWVPKKLNKENTTVNDTFNTK